MKPHPGVNAACNPAAWPREDALPVSRASCSPGGMHEPVARFPCMGPRLRGDDPDALVARFPCMGPRLRGDDPDALVAHQGRLAEEAFRSEERRVGKEWVSTCRYGRSRYQ